MHFKITTYFKIFNVKLIYMIILSAAFFPYSSVTAVEFIEKREIEDRLKDKEEANREKKEKMEEVIRDRQDEQHDKRVKSDYNDK